MIDSATAKRCADAFHALSDPHRVMVVECLRSGTKNVTQLSRLLNAELVNVSHHLGVLRDLNVVIADKKGRFVNYSLNPELFQAESDNTTVMELGWCRVEFFHV
ncbi:MAG: metalloregulator ArsR/SmtB family transcription factor [Gemmataceae bacterium]|jgi:ArsR family transcriptional regulator